MDIERSGQKKCGQPIKMSSSDITPAQMKSSACKMVRTLVQLMRTLDGIPEERMILMKLYYYDEKTPKDYDPPFFRGCSEEDKLSWSKLPLNLSVGQVDSKHYTIALKVCSILDPCEEAGEVRSNVPESQSQGLENNKPTDSEGISESQENARQSGALSGKKVQVPNATVDSKMAVDLAKDSDGETEDEDYENQAFNNIKDWVTGRQTDTVDIADIMAAFPEISMALIEDTVKRLVKASIVSHAGGDMYRLNMKDEQDSKKHDYLANSQSSQPSQEITSLQVDTTSQQSEKDPLYIKALYYSLQLEYVTIAALQGKLGPQASFTATKKLVDRMVEEGYVEAIASNKRLGRKVLHTCQADMKLREVTAALSLFNIQKTSHIPEPRENVKEVSADQDTSRIAKQLSYGSDNTRSNYFDQVDDTAARKEGVHTGKTHHFPAVGKEDSCGSGYIAKLGHNATPAASCTSPGQNMMFDQMNHDSQGNEAIDLSQKIRKSSVVEDPILQTAKRFRSEI